MISKRGFSKYLPPESCTSHTKDSKLKREKSAEPHWFTCSFYCNSANIINISVSSSQSQWNGNTYMQLYAFDSCWNVFLFLVSVRQQRALKMLISSVICALLFLWLLYWMGCGTWTLAMALAPFDYFPIHLESCSMKNVHQFLVDCIFILLVCFHCVFMFSIWTPMIYRSACTFKGCKSKSVLQSFILLWSRRCCNVCAILHSLQFDGLKVCLAIEAPDIRENCHPSRLML